MTEEHSQPPIELRQPDALPYKILLGIFFPILHFYYRFEFEGLENLPSKGPAILVANHQSYLDVPTIGIALKKRKLIHQTHWVIGKPTSKISALQWLFAFSPLIVVNGTVRNAEAALKQGAIVVIFPEGYYTWHKYKRIKEGNAPPKREPGKSAAILALKTGVPVIPLGLRGTEEHMPPYNFLPKPGKLGLKVGVPFQLEQVAGAGAPDALVKEKSEMILSRIDELR